MIDAQETLDDQFFKVAEVVPGFGGMFYDENSNLNIYLLEPDQTNEIKKAVVAIFGEEALLRRTLVEQEDLPLAVELTLGQIKVI